MRSRLTYANVMATIAVFVALGGSSYAALLITGRQVKDNSLTGADVKDGSLTGRDVRAHSLRARNFRAGELPRGPQGPPGQAAQFEGVAAGGVLTGTYPNPGLADNVVGGANIAPGAVTGSNIAPGAVTGANIAPGAVTGANVAADALTGANIDESTLASVPSANNAAALGGAPATQFPQMASTGTSSSPLRFFSYFANTSTTTELPIGQVKIETHSVAGDIILCGNTGAVNTEPYVAYVNGTRSTGTITGSSCAAAVNPGAGGDFEFRVRRADIVGVHSGDSTTSKNYQVMAFSSLG